MANVNPTIGADRLMKILVDELEPREIISLLIDQLVDRRSQSEYKYRKLTLSYQIQLLISARNDLKELA